MTGERDCWNTNFYIYIYICSVVFSNLLQIHTATHLLQREATNTISKRTTGVTQVSVTHSSLKSISVSSIPLRTAVWKTSGNLFVAFTVSRLSASLFWVEGEKKCVDSTFSFLSPRFLVDKVFTPVH